MRYQVLEDNSHGSQSIISESVSGSTATLQDITPGVGHTYRIWAYRFWGGRMFAPAPTAAATGAAAKFAPPAVPGAGGGGTTAPQAAVTAKKATRPKKGARPATPRAWKARSTRGRVLISLPKLDKGQRFEIMRATKAKYGRIATTTRRSYLDRKVKAGKTYRYRLVLVSATGVRSLPSKTITVRVRRG